MCYICGHMWYEKFQGIFDCKVVKFHFWTPCKHIFCFHRAKNRPKSVIFFVNGLLGNKASWTIGFLAKTTFLIFLDTLYLMFISIKFHFRKTRDHFFISAPIFKFKVSINSSHQCGLCSVVLLKIDLAVPEILMKTCFVQNVFH